MPRRPPIVEQPECPNADQHVPHPDGYVAHAEWADQMLTTHRQKRCPGCGRMEIWVPKKTSHASPKDLRVGINSAMVEHAALVKLLIAKGLITEAEYSTALADAMEAERDLYAAELGPGVKLA